MKKVLNEGLKMKKREQFSDSAARFHNAPMHLQMATQTLNLMRLYLNKILNLDYTVQDLELKDQENKETASDLLLSEQHIYKDWDYRCLVPYSHKDPTKWKTYDMHEYRRAYNKETYMRKTSEAGDILPPIFFIFPPNLGIFRPF